MSQGQLARESDIAATQLSRYETGRATPRKLALARLSQALAVNLKWLETGTGTMDEYPDTGLGGLTFTIDRELSDRLRAYASLNELTLAEALAEMLDFPLSGYAESELPKTPADLDAFKKMLNTYGKKRMVRTVALANKIRVHPSEAAALAPSLNVIVADEIRREVPTQEFMPGTDPGTKHRPAQKRRFIAPKKK